MKHMKKLFLTSCIMLLVFGVVGIATAGPYPVTDFLNGSFESGTMLQPNWFDNSLDSGFTGPTSWDVVSGDIDWISEGYWTASDGSRSIDLNGENPGSISQTFATNAGATYDVAFDLAGNPGRQIDKLLRVSAYSGDDLLAQENYTFKYDDAQSKTNMGWVTYNDFSFLGTGDDVRLVFESLTSGDGGPALDNVVVTDAPPPPSPTPEPASMLLLGTGLIGLVGVGRKKFLKK